MNQSERRAFLIKRLLDEQPSYKDISIPNHAALQKNMLRSLMNLRMPSAIDDGFLVVQDEYLREETAAKGITDVAELSPVADGLYLWQGDITTLRCDAIVNAANSGMTGCYVPCHKCIDNCIHTYAGIQLRLECARLMAEQGHEEATGKAKITRAYNLPCKYVIHTVGPIINRRVTDEDRELLSSCYRSCLTLADERALRSIAFCCISTGEFHFPNDLAAEIALQTVKDYKSQNNSSIEVIFNVFKDADYEIYRNLFAKH